MTTLSIVSLFSVEIEHLLKEQDKRIKKCRKNEKNIQALLL